MKNNPIELSVIIPVYNGEKYLPECLDALMHQDGLVLEIIIINDGSNDRSGEIAEQYSERDNRINVIHQENGGLSAARNTGLKSAQGEYIAFVDSDDRVKEDSLIELYREAVKYKADVVMGKIWYYHPDGTLDNPFKPIPKDIFNKPIHGKESFIRLIKSEAFSPMVFNFIYRREFLEKIEARFEEGIMNEDELWTPVVLCQAENMIITGHEFYYYRQHSNSLMRTKRLEFRLKSLFRVTEGLNEFADRFDYAGEDGALKNWLIVRIFILYIIISEYVSDLKDSSIPLPNYHFDRFWRDSWEMMPEPQKICRDYFSYIEANFKKYTDWRISESVEINHSNYSTKN